MGWLLLDVAWLVVFAAIGRASHDEGVTAVGVAAVAWPFVAGYAVGVLVTGLRRTPRSLGRALPTWLIAVAVAMAIRTVLEGALPPISFIVVALAFSGAGLLGWRVVALLIGRRRTPAAAG